MKAILAKQSMAIMMVAVLALIGAHSAIAQTTYNWTGGSAAWDTDANWGGNQPYANAGDIGEVSTGTCSISATPFLGQLNINPGGMLEHVNNIQTTADNLHLKGGRIRKVGTKASTLAGNIYVEADTILDSTGTSSSAMTISATLYGSNNFERLIYSGNSDPVIAFSGDNQAFSGNWLVTDGTLQFKSDNAAGTGSILVNGGIFNLTQATTLTNKVTIMPGATLNARSAGSGTSTLENLILNGGRIYKKDQSPTPTLAGHITVTADSYLETPTPLSGTIGVTTISADIEGDHRLIYEGIGAFAIRGDNSAFSGGWTTLFGSLRFATPDSVGTGSVLFDAGTEFRLFTDSDWTLPNDFGGGGTLIMGAAGNANRKLTLTGSRITTENSDGTSGILKIWYRNSSYKVDVDLAADGSKLCELVISVTGAGDTPGEDHGQLTLIQGSQAGELTGLENCDLVVDSTSMTSAAEFDAETVLTIVECGNDLTGMAFNSVTFEGPFKAKSISYNNGSITLGDWAPYAQPTLIIIR